jgi:hypothetical protein
MPRAKKEAAAEAVEKVKAVAVDAKATVKAAAETVADKAETVVEKAKTAAKSTRVVKKAVEKTAKTPRAKKAPEFETKVVIELPEVSESTAVLVERAKADWTAKGNSLDDVKQLSLYINAPERMVYYVVNDDYLSGNFAF